MLIKVIIFLAILTTSSAFLAISKKNIATLLNLKTNDIQPLRVPSQKSYKNKDTSNLSGRTLNSSTTDPRNLSLTFSQLKPFIDIASPFFKEDEKARNSLIGVLAMTLLNSGVSVAFSYISRDFYNALNARDEPLFYEKIALFFAALVVAVPVSVYYRFLREKLSLYWREGLTSRVLQKYYSNRTFYVMETLHDIDNPDQRISEDIKAFTRTSLDFFITLFTSAVDLFSFSGTSSQPFPNSLLAQCVLV